MCRRRPHLRCLLLLVILRPIAPAVGAPGPPAFDPTDRYETRKVEGWTVLVNKAFLDDRPELAGATLKWLGNQLELVAHKVPAGSLAKLRAVRIWVEEREPHHPCMAYHPDPAWLLGHGMNPEKAGCVEIADARNFLNWTRKQPWMVLHELAHAYHHQSLEGGFGNPKVEAAYRRAVGQKRYDSVLHHDGKEVRAYAAENPMEYFAESSEAFFGANDFYPFVRAELRRHDPEMDSLLKTLWEAP